MKIINVILKFKFEALNYDTPKLRLIPNRYGLLEWANTERGVSPPQDEAAAD